MKRPSTLIGAIDRINSKLTEIQELQELKGSVRVVRINSPEPDGPVEVVLEHKKWPNKKAITMNADGTFSGLSYWTEGQI